MNNLKASIRRFLTCASIVASTLPALAGAVPVFDNGPPDHVSANNMGLSLIHI